jgi:hypothetical protein
MRALHKTPLSGECIFAGFQKNDNPRDFFTFSDWHQGIRLFVVDA